MASPVFMESWQAIRLWVPVSLCELETFSPKPPSPEGLPKDLEKRSDAELLVLFAKCGEHEVFEKLSRRILPFIERVALVNPERRAAGIPVEEVAQEVLLNLFRYAGSFQVEKSYAFNSWLRRIVVNAVSQVRRQSGGRPMKFLDDAEAIVVEDSRVRGPLNDLCREESLREGRCQAFLISLRVAAAWGLLTVLQREILRRVCFEGKNYAEIGKEMGMNADAVKMAAFRGRRRLQKHVFPKDSVEVLRAVI